MVGGDVTELVPQKDVSNITTKVASRCVAQMLTGLSMTP
jgi:arginase family enzyme